MNKTILALAAASAIALPAAPAFALELDASPNAAFAAGYENASAGSVLGYAAEDRWNDRRYRDRRDYRESRRDYRDGYRDARRHEARYDRYGRYAEPRRVSRNDKVWRGRDGRYYCERDNGTTGLIIGAAGGALIGREIDSRGDRTVGTLLGAAIGGLLGREIDRGGARCR